VPGGGTALLKISHILRKKLNKKKFENDVVKRGYEAMLDIIRMPAKTIISSVSKDAELLMSKIEKHKNFNFGFNAKTEKLTNDLLKDGVIDPVKVTKTALIYSTSNATTFLTTDCVITLDLPNTRMDANDEVMIYDDE
jgi:chaperonin GroEL